MDKRGWSSPSKLSWFDLLIGAILILVGLLPILGGYSYSSLSFLNDSFIESRILLAGLLCLGGLFLFYNSFLVSKYREKRLNTIIMGFVMLLVGIAPLVLEYDLVRYVGFSFQYSVLLEIMQGLMIFFGIYLIIDSFLLPHLQ